MNPVPRITGILILAVVMALLAGCTSAEELMEDAARLESEGRFEEAARKYIDAYDKDPSIAELDELATSLGNRVIDDLLAEAESAHSDGRPVESAERYMRIDELVLRAFDAGIYLDRPSDYGDRRYKVFRDAVSALMDEAIEIFDGGDFSRADATLRDVLSRFDPTADETESVLATRYDVLLAWADGATREGRYREAVAKADEALAVAEQLGAAPEPALSMRTRAIELGTLYVAAAPVRSTERDRDTSSPWLLAELNDRLELNFWSTPPELIAVAHSALVRQRLRHLGFGRHPLSRWNARILATDLNADFVILTDVERFEWTEQNMTDSPKRARTRSGRNAVYSEIKGRIEYEAQIRIRIVSRNGDAILDDHVRGQRSRDFKRATFDGDYRDLELSSTEVKLFRTETFDDLLTEIESELIDRVTERIADRVYSRLEREVR